MNSCNHGHNTSVDYLSIRVRRIVRSLIEKERKFQPLTLLAFFTGSNHYFITKILSSVSFTICIAMFATQVCDRIAYYLTDPINTDVFITNSSQETFPLVTICHDPGEATKKLFDQLNIGRKCRNTAMETLYKNRVRSVEQAWTNLKTANGIVSAETSSSEILTFNDVFLPYGICTTFHTNITLAMQKDQGRFRIIFSINQYPCFNTTANYLYVHEAYEHPMSRYEHEPMPGFFTMVKIGIKKYHFQNRKGHPCISSSDYTKCVHECFANFSINAAPCRLQFQPVESMLQICNPKTNNNRLWRNVQDYLRGQGENSCKCTRQCSNRIFGCRVEQMDSSGNQSEYILDFGGSSVIVIKERFVYTLVQLLADIGGNSGLWIGFSVLSVFNYLTFVCQPKKKPKNMFAPTDPLYIIVAKRIKRDRIILNHRRVNILTSTRQWCKNIRLLFVGSVCLVFTYAAFNRIKSYYQHPVHCIVDISFLETVHSPSVTICPGDQALQDLQKHFITDKNIADYCEVEIWQLVGHRNVNADQLWTHNNVYIKPPTGYYDYNLYFHIAGDHKHSISYVLKKIENNEDSKECVTEIDHENCKQACLVRKLWQRITCWLPFMPPSELPMCNSPSAAKHSLEAYTKLFVLPEGSSDCNCFPPCSKHIYEVEVESEKYGKNWLSFGFGAKHNIMETYRKVQVYPLVALLCEIGSLLGSTLGLCVFGALDVIINVAEQFKKSRLLKIHKI